MAGVPIPQDLFSRFMARAFDEKQIISCSTVFQSFFGNPMTNSETIFSPDSLAVDIDIIRGNERIAALTPRGVVSRTLGSNQKNVRSELMSTFSRKYPLSEEEGDITGDILLNRIAGENPYDRQTRMDRMRYHALKIHHENMRRHIRMFEVLAAQSVIAGVQDAIIGTTNTDLQFDFRRKSTHTVTASPSWAGGSGTIMADIDAACLKVRADGHVHPDMMICGATSLNSFIQDTAIKAEADNRRFEFVDMKISYLNAPKELQRFIDAGLILQGKLRTPGGFDLWVFAYVDGYTAANGTYTKYMPDTKVVICSSKARCDRYFGPPENLPMVPMREALYRDYFGFDPTSPPMPGNIKGSGAVIDPAMFYVDAYVSGDWKKISIRTQSAPIFATTMTDCFVTITT